MGIHIIPPLFELVLKKRTGEITVYSDGFEGHLSYDDGDYMAVHDWTGVASYSVGHDWRTLGQLRAGIAPDYTYLIRRWRIRFDTSGIPPGATIESAIMSLNCRNDFSVVDFDIVVVNGADLFGGSPGLEYGYLLDDTQSMGSINTYGILIDEYNDIILNALGMAAINPAGFTQFGLRTSLDISASAPTLSEAVNIYTANMGGDYRPKLYILYSYYG